MPFLIDFLKNPPLSSSFPSRHRLCFQRCLSITLRSLPSLMWVTIHLLWSILNSALMQLCVCTRVCAPVSLCMFCLCLRVCVHHPPLLLYQPGSDSVFIASHERLCEHLRSFYFIIAAPLRVFEYVWALCPVCWTGQSLLILTAGHFSNRGLNPKTGTYRDMHHARVCKYVCPSLVYSSRHVLFALHGQKVLEPAGEIWSPECMHTHTLARTYTRVRAHSHSVCLWKRAVSAALTHHSSLATNSVRPLSSFSHPTLLSENSIRG